MTYLKRSLQSSNPMEITCGTMRELTGYKDYNDLNVIHVTIKDETKKHYHNKQVECYYVLKGSLDLQLDDKTEPCKAGDFVMIFPGTKHKARKTSTQPAEVLVISAPSWRHDDEILVE